MGGGPQLPEWETRFRRTAARASKRCRCRAPARWAGDCPRRLGCSVFRGWCGRLWAFLRRGEFFVDDAPLVLVARRQLMHLLRGVTVARAVERLLDSGDGLAFLCL